MTHLIVRQSDYLIYIVDINSNSELQTVQNQKQTDLDLHCLQRKAEHIQVQQDITKTCLFKYIENFTTKKGTVSDKKKSDIFIFLLKT